MKKLKNNKNNNILRRFDLENLFLLANKCTSECLFGTVHGAGTWYFFLFFYDFG